MSNEIIDISRFSPSDADTFLFDCNVLMYVFYTFGGYKDNTMSSYKKLFNTLAPKENCIYFPAVLISEFCNTFIRNEYRRYLRQNNLNATTFNFKQSYRPTTEYKDTINEISDIVNHQLLALPSAIVCNDGFDSLNICRLFNNENQFDFNDRYYGELSKLKNCYIVTHDKDFKFIDGISIITNCNALLNSQALSPSTQGSLT